MGVVTKYEWRMPHVFLQVRGPNSSGELVDWTIELLHPAGMVERGWSPDSLKPGDQIRWEGTMDRDPNRYYMGLKWAEKADGTRLNNNWEEEEATPVVEPSTDFTGMWMRDSRVGFSYYPPADWPYNEMAQTLVDQFDETQNPQYSCINPGPPKSTLLPYPLRITRPEPDTFVLDYDMRGQQRVFTLGHTPERTEPTVVGQSRAWMDGETLVVETDNFVADRWGSQTGVDSSDQKHLIERFSLIEDGYTLRIQMTLTDPVYFTAPVEIDYYMKKLPDRDIMPENCSIEAARLFIEAGYSE